MPAFSPFATCAAVYCFPAVLGFSVHGQKTGIVEEWPTDIELIENLVWPDENGSSVGRSILPLHSGARVAIGNIEGLSEVLSLFDVARANSGRACDHAISLLSRKLGTPERETHVLIDSPD